MMFMVFNIKPQTSLRHILYFIAKTINMFINGTGVSTDGLNENAPGLDANNITDVLYIGRDANSFFVGVIDEVSVKCHHI